MWYKRRDRLTQGTLVLGLDRLDRSDRLGDLAWLQPVNVAGFVLVSPKTKLCCSSYRVSTENGEGTNVEPDFPRAK